jgi:cold shock CspA family protein
MSATATDDINCSSSNDPTVDSTRLTGRVKWFNNKTGFGFITALGDSEGVKNGSDVFVHHSTIKVAQEQYRYLVQGEYVEFVLSKTSESSKHEFQAVDVRESRVASSFARRVGRAGRPEPGLRPAAVVHPTGVANGKRPAKLLHLHPGRADLTGGEVTAAAGVDAAEVFQPSEHTPTCIEFEFALRFYFYLISIGYIQMLIRQLMIG